RDVLARRGNAGDCAPDAGAVEGRVLLEQVERKDDVCRRERLAVAPLHALPDRVDQGRRIRKCVPGSEERRVHAADCAGNLKGLVDQTRSTEFGRLEGVEILHQGGFPPIALNRQDPPPPRPPPATTTRT